MCTIGKLSNNILHHTYTNIDGLDGDIDQDPFLLFQNRRGLYDISTNIFMHFLYTLGTITWAFMDFVQYRRFSKLGLSPEGKLNKPKQFRKLAIYKAAYWTFIFVLPMLFLHLHGGKFLGWLVMNMVAGFISR